MKIIHLELDKKCKHSNRYACEEQDLPVQSIYVKKPFSTDVEKFVVTIEENES